MNLTGFRVVCEERSWGKGENVGWASTRRLRHALLLTSSCAPKQAARDDGETLADHSSNVNNNKV